MPDITMCRNEKCIKKQSCYRFTATPKEFGQWVQVFEPKDNTEEKFECENHFPNNDPK
jgi:hypothetical protein